MVLWVTTAEKPSLSLNNGYYLLGIPSVEQIAPAIIY